MNKLSTNLDQGFGPRFRLTYYVLQKKISGLSTRAAQFRRGQSRGTTESLYSPLSRFIIQYVVYASKSNPIKWDKIGERAIKQFYVQSVYLNKCVGNEGYNGINFPYYVLLILF